MRGRINGIITLMALAGALVALFNHEYDKASFSMLVAIFFNQEGRIT